MPFDRYDFSLSYLNELSIDGQKKTDENGDEVDANGNKVNTDDTETRDYTQDDPAVNPQDDAEDNTDTTDNQDTTTDTETDDTPATDYTQDDTEDNATDTTTTTDNDTTQQDTTTDNTDDTTTDDTQITDYTQDDTEDNTDTNTDTTTDTETDDTPATDYTQDDTAEGDAGTNTTGGTDDTAGGNQTAQGTDGGDTGNTGEGEDDTGTTDYTQDDTEGGDGGEGGDTTATDGEDQGNTDDTTDQAATPTSSELLNNIKDLETQLFSNLTPEQINIKNIELKTKFIDMHELVQKIITRVDNLKKTEENLHTLDFVIKKLTELLNMLNDYITKTYDTNTYIENQVNYKTFLVTLEIISKILEQVKGITKSDLERLGLDKKNEK